MLVTIVTELTYQFPAQGFINAIRTDRKVLVRGVPRCLRVTAAGSGISQRVLVDRHHTINCQSLYLRLVLLYRKACNRAKINLFICCFSVRKVMLTTQVMSVRCDQKFPRHSLCTTK